MKVLITYMSNTGNTKKVAEAIFEEIKEDKEIMPIDQIDSIDSYDLTFLGFPVKKMGPDKKTRKLLNRHCIDGRNVVLFITHAAPEGSSELQSWLEKFRNEASKANIVDLFDCQGELGKTIKWIMSIMPNKDFRRWVKEDNSQGQPDETRIERARVFTREVMEKFRKNHRVIGEKELLEKSIGVRVSDPILTK